MSHVNRAMPLSKRSASAARRATRPCCRGRSGARWPRRRPSRYRSRRSCPGTQRSPVRRATSPAIPCPTSNFSTGNDSPVREPWMTNRSLAETIRTSAGIMSPAASFTTSPGTSWEIGQFLSLSVAEDGRRDRDHGLELRGGGVGPVLLNELHADAQDDHQTTSRCRLGSRRWRTRTRPARQQQDEGIDECVPEEQPGALPVRRRPRHWGRARRGALLPRPWSGPSPGSRAAEMWPRRSGTRIRRGSGRRESDGPGAEGLQKYPSGSRETGPARPHPWRPVLRESCPVSAASHRRHPYRGERILRRVPFGRVPAW